jgi:hypothetical protein
MGITCPLRPLSPRNRLSHVRPECALSRRAGKQTQRQFCHAQQLGQVYGERSFGCGGAIRRDTAAEPVLSDAYRGLFMMRS